MKRALPYFLSILLLLHSNIQAQNSKLSIEKEPSWITVNNLDYNDRQLESEAEDGYFDVAYEYQISLKLQSRYFKRSLKILSEAGVQNASEISVSFDPSYEQLVFHTIRILRDGKTVNKVQLARFKTIQQEKDLSMHMYNGSLTALLFLEDVRKGDVIEYSYTIRGFNPIFDGRYADSYDCRFSVPLGILYYKLIVPASRNIIIKNRETSVNPIVSNTRDEKIYEWKFTNAAPVHLETKLPRWYEPYPVVMISEYNNWKEVSTWASALFPMDVKLSQALSEKVESIKAAGLTNEARTLAALRFVQDDIRYMGIEMGTRSHKPSHPNVIFGQRFGDCKDKSYLLTVMLKAMDIEASPVLINTRAKSTINNFLPSATAFDHVTVQVKIRDKVYWFDPTISYQRGSLADISYPDYQTGLVINAATTALTPIPFHEPGMSDIKEIFNIPDLSGLAHFKVVTKNTGSFADDARSYFNNNSLYEMKNKYKDFYAAYFDKITADSLSYKDDPQTGAFVITEYYTLRNIWKMKDGIQKSPFDAYVINSIMTKPTDQNRTMPFYLNYPARYKEQIEINLPENWPMEDFEQKISCASFLLRAKGYSTANSVILNYEYENLKDHVMPGEAAAFFSNYSEASQATGYSLSYKPRDKSSSYISYDPKIASSSNLFPKLYTVLAVCVFITFLVRRQRQKEY